MSWVTSFVVIRLLTQNLQPIAYSNLTTDSTRLLYIRSTEATSRDFYILFHDVMRSCSTWRDFPYKIVEDHVNLGTFEWLPSSSSMPWRTQVQPSPRCTLLLFLLMWSPSNRSSTRSIVILEFEVLVLDGMPSFSHTQPSSTHGWLVWLLYPVG